MKLIVSTTLKYKNGIFESKSQKKTSNIKKIVYLSIITKNYSLKKNYIIFS